LGLPRHSGTDSERYEQGWLKVSKRRPLRFLLLPGSMLLLAACAHQTHHGYNGVRLMPPATSDELQWDRTGSTANGTLTLGGGAAPTPGLAVAPHADVPGPALPAGTYRLAITFTADTFAGFVSEFGGKEVATATGTVTATGVDLTVTAPEKAPFTISFTSTQPGAYTYSPGEYK